jgi:hypothetical protein
MAKVIIEGEIPKDPRQRVLMIEAAVEAICRSVGEDPADAGMVLLTAAVHLAMKHSGGKPMSVILPGVANALGYAAVAADDFFTPRIVGSKQ